MKCTRCGKPATTRREAEYYCGACSIGIDWQQLIHLIQEAPVEAAVAPLVRSA